jgi:hypothetical protein
MATVHLHGVGRLCRVRVTVFQDSAPGAYAGKTTIAILSLRGNRLIMCLTRLLNFANAAPLACIRLLTGTLQAALHTSAHCFLACGIYRYIHLVLYPIHLVCKIHFCLNML